MQKGFPIGFYTRKITIDDVRKAKPEKIYYSIFTKWWTHDPQHVKNDLGDILIETHQVEDYLQEPEKNPDHYGRHGIEAFMAAHHLNCVHSEENPESWAFCAWDEYNDMIDRSLENLTVEEVKESPPDEKEKRLIDLFNKLFKILGIEYEDLNKRIFVAGESRNEKILLLEKEYPELGLIENELGQYGISLVSLLATITDIFCEKRMSVIVEEGGLISGARFWNKGKIEPPIEEE